MVAIKPANLAATMNSSALFLLFSVLALTASSTQHHPFTNRMGPGMTSTFVPSTPFAPNKISRDAAIKLASQLTYGMPEETALAFLKRNGLKEDMGAIGDSFGWSDGFTLSNGFTLGLIVEPKQIAPDGEWINGLLKKAYIYRPNGKNADIPLKNAP